MSVLFKRDESLTGSGFSTSNAGRGGLYKGAPVRPSAAMGHSVIWGAVRLRANIESLMPVDVFRKVAGVRVEAPTPPVLIHPWDYADGQPQFIDEWLYSSRTALDRYGNSFGIKHGVNAFGLPAQIELVNPDLVQVRMKGSQITEYRYNGSPINSKYVWHERQYTIAGLPIGLSPIANAATSIATGMSAQDFALGWFQNGTLPGSVLKNTERTLVKDISADAKAQFKESITAGDIFVTGKDWEYTPIAAKAAEAEFLNQQAYTDTELCRFMDVPADLLDVVIANSGSGKVTYGNITQRNLQVLVINMAGSIKRRETALRRLVPASRYVKLNRSAFLAMDDKTRAEVNKLRIDSRTILPSEVRGLEDQAPYTDEQYAEFDRLFPPSRTQTATQTPVQPA